MGIGIIYHTLLVLAIFFDIRVMKLSRESSTCLGFTAIHKWLYILINVIIIIFYFRMFKKGKEDSIDILIFNKLIKQVKVLIILPFSLFFTFLCSRMKCRYHNISIKLGIFLIFQLFFEMLLLYFYLKWYQSFLFTNGKSSDEIQYILDKAKERRKKNMRFYNYNENSQYSFRSDIQNSNME